MVVEGVGEGKGVGDAVTELMLLPVGFGNLDFFACFKPQESLEGAAVCWVWLFYEMIS